MASKKRKRPAANTLALTAPVSKAEPQWMTAARSRQRELVGSLQQTPMFLELCEHLTEKLPLSQLPSDKLPSKPDLVKAVHESTNVLADWRKDVKDFAGSLCDHAVSLHVIGDRVASEQAKALHQAKRPLLAAVDQHLQPIPPVLTADLLPLPIEEVFGTVQTWSREACRDVVVQSLLALEAMVEHDMMGLIEWTDVTTCKIHYFEHAIQQSISTTRHSTRTFDNVSQIIEERVRTRGRNNFAVIGHEHHLMNAEAHELGESRFPLPQRIHNLVHKIPDWLMPYVRVLEGDLILERVFRRDVATTRWEFEEVRRLEIVTDPRVSESAGYDADPAILLGPYVLTGWGQREIQREQRRRSQAIKQAPTTTSRSVHSAEYQKLKPWAQGITAVAMLMMLFSRLQHTVMVPMALLMTMIAIAMVGKAMVVYAQSRSETLDVLLAASLTICAALGILASQSLMYGILFGNLKAFILAFPLAVLSLVTKHVADSRHPE